MVPEVGSLAGLEIVMRARGSDFNREKLTWETRRPSLAQQHRGSSGVRVHVEVCVGVG